MGTRDFEVYAPLATGMQGLAQGLLDQYNAKLQFNMKKKLIDEQRQFEKEEKNIDRQREQDRYEKELERKNFIDGVQLEPSAVDKYAIPEVGPIQEEAMQGAQAQGLIGQSGRPQPGMLSVERPGGYQLNKRGQRSEQLEYMKSGTKEDGSGRLIWDKDSPAYKNAEMANMLKAGAFNIQQKEADRKFETINYISEAEKKADEEFGKTYNEYFNEGGLKAVENDIQLLGKIENIILDKNSDVSGWSKIAPKFVRETGLLGEDQKIGAAIEDMLRKISSKTIKLLYGGNPSLKEVEQNAATLWSKMAPEEVNLEKIKQQKLELISKRDALLKTAEGYRQTSTTSPRFTSKGMGKLPSQSQGIIPQDQAPAQMPQRAKRKDGTIWESDGQGNWHQVQ